MADSTTISALLNLQNPPSVKSRAGGRSATSADLFSAVMSKANTFTASTKSRQPPAPRADAAESARANDPRRSTLSQDAPSDQRASASQATNHSDRPESATQSPPDNSEEPLENGSDIQAHAGVDSDTDAGSAESAENRPAQAAAEQPVADYGALSPEQEEILASLPEDQAAALLELPIEQQAALLEMPSEQRAALMDLLLADVELEGLPSQIAGLLEGSTVAELVALEKVLGKFAALLEEGINADEALSQLDAMISEEGLPKELSGALLAELQSLTDADGSLDVAAVQAQIGQLQQASRTLAEITSRVKELNLAATDALGGRGERAGTGVNIENGAAGQLAKDNSEQPQTAVIVKLQAGKVSAEMLAQGAGDKGKLVSEAAQLHNLFSARTDATSERSSTQHVASLAQLSSQASQAPGQVKVPVTQAQVATSFHSPNWGQAVSQKVVWLAQQGIKSAEIRLDPPDLGPLHVKVTVNNDQAQVSFTSHQAVVREALDQSAHRLREMLAEQGMTQVDVGVSDEQSQQLANQNGEGGGEGKQNHAAQGDDELEGAAVTVSEVGVGLIDHYA